MAHSVQWSRSHLLLETLFCSPSVSEYLVPFLRIFIDYSIANLEILGSSERERSFLALSLLLIFDGYLLSSCAYTKTAALGAVMVRISYNMEIEFNWCGWKFYKPLFVAANTLVWDVGVLGRFPCPWYTVIDSWVNLERQKIKTYSEVTIFGHSIPSFGDSLK